MQGTAFSGGSVADLQVDSTTLEHIASGANRSASHFRSGMSLTSAGTGGLGATAVEDAAARSAKVLDEMIASLSAAAKALGSHAENTASSIASTDAEIAGKVHNP
jgi:hypothetical protein